MSSNTFLEGALPYAEAGERVLPVFGTDQVALRVSRRIDGVLSQAGRMLLFG